MSNASLLGFSIERFKSFCERTLIAYAPLTVIVGRNNSGKSTLIQSLLLLKQTLAARTKAPLHLDGIVSAFNLRELTSGWPDAGETNGPAFGLRWECRVDHSAALQKARNPDIRHLIRRTGLATLESMLEENDPWLLTTRLDFETGEEEGVTVLNRIRLVSETVSDATLFDLRRRGESWQCHWGQKAEEATHIEVDVDTFLPYLRLDRSAIGPKSTQRAWHNTWLLLFAQPVDALKELLLDFHFLGSTRLLPPSLYKPASVAPEEIGASGELAAQLLHRRQNDAVHYLPAIEVTRSSATAPSQVIERSLVDAVNDVLACLSIPLSVSVDEIRDVGFRLLFGSATLQHVGRGLTYLLPLIELGLFADPLRFQLIAESMSLAEYRGRCTGTRVHIALEEPEAHLHPKVQSRLAHWLVSLAMANRSLLVETHSDHLVRRLRGLVARAGAGSALEKWLLDNVLILEVEQDERGWSTVNPSRLTAEGGLGEHWPTDFMDEATSEDTTIYYASLEKQPVEAPHMLLIHDEGDEPEGER